MKKFVQNLQLYFKLISLCISISIISKTQITAGQLRPFSDIYNLQFTYVVFE